jgi:hypothetical protein
VRNCRRCSPSLQRFCPREFRHHPLSSSELAGPSHPLPLRVLATALVLLVLGLTLRSGALFAVPADAEHSASLLPAGLLVLLATWWLLIRARTTIDANGIQQSGLPSRAAAFADLATARIGGPPSMRKLVVRTHAGRRQVFAAGSPQLVAAFESIVAALATEGQAP